MLIAGKELFELIERGVITAKPENVNAASIDVRLADVFFFEADPHKLGETPKIIDLDAKESVPMIRHKVPEGGAVHLHPGDFCLASTVEIFNLPNDISALFVLRSSMARNGLEHMQAGWADAGWNGSSLTLELVNMLKRHPLRLRPGMRIGQMIFHRHADAGDRSYGKIGNYNHTPTTTQGFKGTGHDQ